MIQGNDYPYLHPPFLLTPYTTQNNLHSPEELVAIYHRLHSEGLWSTVFHDNPEQSLFDFMAFFNMPTVMMQMINIVDGDSIQDLAAISWLAGVEQYGGRQRAVASFCVFKDYQVPSITSPMAKLVMEYWFKGLKMDIVIGMTPAANIPAVKFIHRIGFKEICRIPEYSLLNGAITDCVISYVNKEQYGG